MRSDDNGGSAARTNARTTAILGAAMLIGSLAACARISSFFSPPQPVTPVAQATVMATPTPTPAVISTHHRHRKKSSHGKRPTEKSEMAGATSPSASPSPESIPKDSGLTLENDDATMRQATRLISETDQKLARIDARKIAGGDADTYRQASGLATQAHQAADRHDYAAAYGLAGKAALLAQKLGSTSLAPARRAALGK